jgi:hypothetical protein
MSESGQHQTRNLEIPDALISFALRNEASRQLFFPIMASRL